MSFSSEVREELSGILPQGERERKAAVCAFLLCLGHTRRQTDGRKWLSLESDNALAMRKCFTLLSKNANINIVVPESLEMRARRGRKSDKIQIPEEEFRDLSERLGLREVDGILLPDPERIGESTGAVGSFLREAFLCAGSMSDPNREYHLEFSCVSRGQAEVIRRILGQAGTHAGIVLRKRHPVVYLKDSEEIVDVLRFMGAAISLMKVENVRIRKSVVNDTNRKTNCDMANISKTVSAASRQCEDIALLERAGVLPHLSRSLRRMAELRMENPELSLRDLGALVDPPISRSGVNHRLRRLSEEAQKLREQMPEHG